MFKKLIMALAVVGITAMPYAATAANAVTIESTTQVANQTAGDANYKNAVAAKVDDVVKVQVWFHNRQEADSGLVANNLKVKINVPTTGGAITGTVSADNSNTVTGTANVNLTDAGSSLQYIPGSAYWRHNAGDNTHVNYVTTKISDNVVGAGGLIVDNLKPCFNFESTVTIEARVMGTAVSIQKLVRVDGTGADYTAQDSATPGQTLDYVLKIKNQGNTTLKGVMVGDNMPPYMTYVNGSTLLVDANTSTQGKVMPDGITTGGITIDDMAPGGAELVYFKLKLADNIPCGDHPLKNVGIVRAKGIQEVYNVATTNVNVACSTTPPPSTPPTTPSTPELPQTGTESALAGITGTGVLGYTVQAYRKSKRSLADALKNLKR